MRNIVVIGASGAIGAALVEQLAATEGVERVYAFSRLGKHFSSSNIVSGMLDLADEDSIEAAAKQSLAQGAVDMVIVASGLLHAEGLVPEKSLRDLSGEKFAALFAVNTIGPALVMKHFLPGLPREKRGVFAVLSARVGSISDNRLGGWYAYRASKAALNMLVRNAGIEMARQWKQSIVVGLHPGTVDSQLSKPFQNSSTRERLMTPEDSANRLIGVLQGLTPADTGKCFAYDGSEVLP